MLRENEPDYLDNYWDHFIKKRPMTIIVNKSLSHPTLIQLDIIVSYRDFALLVNNNPVATWVQTLIKIPVKKEECCVCVCEFKMREKLTMLKCGHQFHTGCIAKWFEKGNDKCPVCREKALMNDSEVL